MVLVWRSTRYPGREIYSFRVGLQRNSSLWKGLTTAATVYEMRDEPFAKVAGFTLQLVTPGDTAPTTTPATRDRKRHLTCR